MQHKHIIILFIVMSGCGKSQEAKCDSARGELAKGWSDLARTSDPIPEHAVVGGELTLTDLFNKDGETDSDEYKKAASAADKALKDMASSARAAADAWNGLDDPTSVSDTAAKSVEAYVTAFKAAVQARFTASQEREEGMLKDYRDTLKTVEPAKRDGVATLVRNTEIELEKLKQMRAAWDAKTDSLASAARKLHSHGPSVTAQCGAYRRL